MSDDHSRVRRPAPITDRGGRAVWHAGSELRRSGRGRAPGLPGRCAGRDDPIDIGHLRIANEASLRPVLGLFDEVRDWPAYAHGDFVPPRRPTWRCSAMPSRRCYADVPAGMAAAHALPVTPRKTRSRWPRMRTHRRPHVTSSLSTCDDWGLTRVAKLATLIASELVTNAVIHARTPSVMALQRDQRALHVSVQDNDPRPMYRPAPGATGAHNGDHGRGLLILDAMADCWGTLADRDRQGRLGDRRDSRPDAFGTNNRRPRHEQHDNIRKGGAVTESVTAPPQLEFPWSSWSASATALAGRLPRLR